MLHRRASLWPVFPHLRLCCCCFPEDTLLIVFKFCFISVDACLVSRKYEVTRYVLGVRWSDPRTVLEGGVCWWPWRVLSEKAACALWTRVCALSMSRLGAACSRLPGYVPRRNVPARGRRGGAFIRLFVKVLWHDWCPILLCSGTVCVWGGAAWVFPGYQGSQWGSCLALAALHPHLMERLAVRVKSLGALQAARWAPLPPRGWVSQSR